MKPEELRMAAVIAWALVWGVMAVPLVSSLSNWIMLVGSGVLPLLMIALMWPPAVQTVSAVIREAHK